MQPDLTRCHAEQQRCAEHLAEHPGDRGAKLGASDWMAEEVLILADLEAAA
jgi:hypothetical protein